MYQFRLERMVASAWMALLLLVLLTSCQSPSYYTPNDPRDPRPIERMDVPDRAAKIDEIQGEIDWANKRLP
jgi:hypothetical protein